MSSDGSEKGTAAGTAAVSELHHKHQYQQWLPADCHNMRELSRAVFAEFLAMALFVFLGTGSAASTAEFAIVAGDCNVQVARILPIAMTFGMSIMVLVYGIGNISGGHINPAVTFFLFLLREISALRASLIIFAQFSGAVLGSGLLYGSISGLNDHSAGTPPFLLGANSLNPELTEGNGFLLELMGTLILCLTVYLTAVRGGGPSDGQPNLAPLVIGFAVFLAHVVLIPFTGCGINPARTFGPALVNSFAGSDVWNDDYWIYFLGPLVGAMVAFGISLIFAPEGEVDVKGKEFLAFIVHRQYMHICHSTFFLVLKNIYWFVVCCLLLSYNRQRGFGAWR